MSKNKTDLVLFFRALADRTRLRLLNLIGNREVCVCFFVEILGTNQPKISRHLAYLRRAGIVEARREGKWMHYRMSEPPDPTVKSFLKGVRNWLDQDEAMKKERMRLDDICGAPKPPAHLRNAPLPATPRVISASE
jgi:ArsR family transcriptional regulator, arsenate/arsenite/antimonite-responsive transcriptional repressor